MVVSGKDITADLYVVNHHGSNSSSSDLFLDGHPAIETLQRLKERGILLYRTDLQGTIIAYSDGSDIGFNTEASSDWTSGMQLINEDLARQMPLEGQDNSEVSE